MLQTLAQVQALIRSTEPAKLADVWNLRLWLNETSSADDFFIIMDIHQERAERHVLNGWSERNADMIKASYVLQPDVVSPSDHRLRDVVRAALTLAIKL